MLERITVDYKVMGGKPCIRNMRVTVETIAGLVTAGHSEHEILLAYPYLERDDIRAALTFTERKSSVNWKEHVALDPAVLAGKPVIRGTRLTIDFVLDLLSQGWSESDIIRNYPGITSDDVVACLQYAAETAHARKPSQ